MVMHIGQQLLWIVCWMSLHWCTAKKNLLQQTRAHGYYFSNICQGMWTHTHTQGLLMCPRSRWFRIPKNWRPALGGSASFSFMVIKKTAARQPACIRDTAASCGQFGKKKKSPHLIKTQFMAVFNTTLIMVTHQRVRLISGHSSEWPLGAIHRAPWSLQTNKYMTKGAPS